MKKIILALMVVFASAQIMLAASQPKTQSRVNNLNNEVGGTLTAEQKTAIAEIFDAASEQVKEGSTVGKAYSQATKEALKLLTPEQVEAREQHAKDKQNQ